TVTDADRIVFLEDGRIGAVGAHAELLTRSPGYARLYRLHHPGADVARAAGPRSIGRHHRPAVEGTLPARTPSTTPLATTTHPPAHHADWIDRDAADPPTVRLRLPLASSAPRKGRHRRSGPPRPFPVPAQATN
ncbi:MAG: hypothetical protein ACXWYP_05945, partial [Pseudonocardia sp.]